MEYNKSTTPCIVIILGMHRSGTSLTTNILSKAGFHAGAEEEILEGSQWNPDGYYERLSIIKLNSLILERVLCTRPSLLYIYD